MIIHHSEQGSCRGWADHRGPSRRHLSPALRVLLRPLRQPEASCVHHLRAGGQRGGVLLGQREQESSQQRGWKQTNWPPFRPVISPDCRNNGKRPVRASCQRGSRAAPARQPLAGSLPMSLHYNVQSAYYLICAPPGRTPAICLLLSCSCESHQPAITASRIAISLLDRQRAYQGLAPCKNVAA